MTTERPRKRSLKLRGHETSVSIEEPFWQEFKRLANDQGLSINELASRLDEARTPPASLASAIRLHVLEGLKAGK